MTPSDHRSDVLCRYRLTRVGRRVLDDELERLNDIVSYARGADLLPRTT